MLGTKDRGGRKMSQILSKATRSCNLEDSVREEGIRDRQNQKTEKGAVKARLKDSEDAEGM